MLKNILVVDDNKVNRKSLRKILESDYNVFEAVNGEDAIEFLENTDNVISLILLDLIMPIMNGYEFLDRINHDIKFSSIPIIVETSSSDNDDEIKCLSGGASDFITKPYQPEVVKNRVHSIIRLKESVAIINLLEYDRVTGLYTKQFFLSEHRENAKK